MSIDCKSDRILDKVVQEYSYPIVRASENADTVYDCPPLPNNGAIFTARKVNPSGGT